MPREFTGHYTGLGQGILLELNPNILVRDEERMTYHFGVDKPRWVHSLAVCLSNDEKMCNKPHHIIPLFIPTMNGRVH